MSQSALQLIRKCLETQETYLDLSSCGLTDSDFADQSQVGAELGKCTHLRSLIISKSNIYQRPQQADDEAGSSRNYFSYLGDLTELSMLTIYGDYSDILRVSDMSFVANLVNLTYLYISFTQIEEIKGLDKLKKLQELNLPYNKISEIKNLDNLADLQRLNISNNQISNITGLNHLSNLTKLFLNNNEIPELGGMDRLKGLQELHISNNQLKSTKGLDALVSLRCLNVSRNDIQELTELDELDSLLTLDVSYNKITDLKPLFPMLNRLKRTSKMDPANKGKSEAGQIIVNNNPVYRPPYEIVSQGAEAILNYLKELDIQGEHYLYEAKMLIVGQPRSGKTSLRYKLFDSASKLPEQDKTTRGIDIDRLNFTIIDKQRKRQKFYYSVWDFGGQQIYQTTHQFFLTQRSLYVLVMDTGKDNIGSDDATINYWLQAVELLGANSPLLLVQNEMNDRQITIDLPQKRARFPFLKKNYSVNLNALIPQTPSFSKKRLQEFEVLKDDIENELKHLPLIGFPMPKNWVKIREALQDTSKIYPYITRQEYIDLCRRFKITEFERQMELSRIFHDLGIFLHFQESPTLEDFIILQNVWATDAVFAVLDNPGVKAGKGSFTDEDLSGIWEAKGYEKQVQKKLLALMMQFELCYQVDKGLNNVFIVPEMLDDMAPENYKWPVGNDLSLFYRYDFMPRGLLTRLIVRLHAYIFVHDNKQFVWKTGVKIDGVNLGCPETFAEIIETWDNRQLSIRVQGMFAKDLMSKITFQIDALNNDFFKQLAGREKNQKSNWHKMIPCICQTCRHTSDKYFYDYYVLISARGKGKDIQCQKSFDNVQVKDLLDGVFARETTDQHTVFQNRVKKPRRIFISYSRKDEHWKYELSSHLASLRGQDLISDWNDRNIESGPWNAQLEHAINNTDIFILLITKNFISSSYITSVEIKRAYSLYKSGNAMIFPVICDACDWQLLAVTKDEKEFNQEENREMFVWLGKFQAFPRNNKPLKNWDNPQDGLLEVVNELKKCL